MHHFDCVLLKKNLFVHGFIILYLKFLLHIFYIQNAAECTILRPSEKKSPLPPPLLVLSLLASRGLACMAYSLTNLRSAVHTFFKKCYFS